MAAHDIFKEWKNFELTTKPTIVMDASTITGTGKCLDIYLLGKLLFSPNVHFER